MAFGKVIDDPYSLRDPYEEALRPFASREHGVEPSGGFEERGSGYGRPSEAERAFGNKQLAIALAVALALVLAAVGYAWGVLRAPDIGAYADAEIEVVGLGDEAFSVTPAELSELKCSQLTVDGAGKGQGQGGQSKAGVVTAYGPTLERFLEAYGREVSDFDRIVVTCSDGYKVTLHGDMLDGTILLSIAQGKAALDEYHQPLRLVMPAEESGKWCYGICRIEFWSAADDAEAADGASSEETSGGVEASGADEPESAAAAPSGEPAGTASGESFGSKYASA